MTGILNNTALRCGALCVGKHVGSSTQRRATEDLLQQAKHDRHSFLASGQNLL